MRVTDSSPAADPVMGVNITLKTTLARVPENGMPVILGSSQAHLAGVYWELRKMNRKFIISHSVTSRILYYPRPLLRRNRCKRQGF